MTPQERQLIDELFEKLARLEDSPRDADAMAAISQNLRQAPHAIYALVQTVLVQDEALRRANARIQDLESGGVAPEERGPGGFLDTMRDALFGGANAGRPSVPQAGRSPWNTPASPPADDGRGFGQSRFSQGGPGGQGGFGQGGGPGGFGQGGFGQGGGGFQQPAAGGRGGSFLGTAAAAAAGVVGGGLLMNSIRGMMGGGSGSHQSLADSSSGSGASPWGGSGSSNNDLAREAGVNDIGQNSRGGGDSGRSGFFDNASNNNDQGSDNSGGYDSAAYDDSDGGFDDDGGDSDYA
jgi:hypothetical protein